MENLFTFVILAVVLRWGLGLVGDLIRRPLKVVAAVLLVAALVGVITWGQVGRLATQSVAVVVAGVLHVVREVVG
jgi:hypothetical protein